MAITLTTPITETNTSTKIKIMNISWVHSGIGTDGKAMFAMSVIYKDNNGVLKTFTDFTRANCKNISNRMENIMLSKPLFAGTQGDDPDEI